MAMRVFNVLLVAVLMAFLATSSLAEDPTSSSLAEDPFVIYSGDGRMAKRPCCKRCECTPSVVLECKCTDVKAYCPSSCKTCRCTKSIPPQCQCMDITKDNCGKSCSADKY